MPPRRKLVSPGSIDKFEFAALAEEIEQNYKRRSVLTAAAAAVGAVIVAKSSEEYAIAQKTFRGYYIEQKAEEAQRRCFPHRLAHRCRRRRRRRHHHHNTTTTTTTNHQPPLPSDHSV